MVVTKNVSIMFGVFKENKEKPLLRKNIAITKHDFLAKQKTITFLFSVQVSSSHVNFSYRRFSQGFLRVQVSSHSLLIAKMKFKRNLTI